MSNKFFVYGTLKEGGHFAKQFDKLRTNNKTATLKGFDLFRIGGQHAWFPGIVKGNGTVIGELHEYDENHIKRVFQHMDAIEGYDEQHPERSMYRREKALVTLEDKSTEEANIYIFNSKIPKDYPKINSGIWPV